jgi:Tfp pilus assembly protein PilX
MTHDRCTLSNEHGTILAAVILILALLSLIGFASVRLSNTEVMTAGNELAYKQNIYTAEAGVVESAQRVWEATGVELSDSTNFQWLNLPAELPDSDNIFNADNWTDANSQIAAISGDSRFMAVTDGVGAGDSLDMSRSRIHAYSLYGRCRRNNGLAIIRIGYQKAF